MGHHHHHHDGTTGKVLTASLAATVLFVVVQVWAGLYADSIALLSDAGHNLTDALALGLALLGFYLQSKPPDEVKTFGYQRGGVLAAFINALMLMGLSLYLFYESYERLLNPREVHEPTMIVVASVGIVLNAAVMWGLHRSSPHDLNIRAASLHMLGDALGSLAIVAGAVLIHYTGWLSVDPILSILIAALIIWTAAGVTRESLNILLEGLPRGIQLKSVAEAMRGQAGVIDVHDLHIWSLGSSSHALSCHVLICDMPPSESNAILQRINGVLAEQFRIYHTTVQFEHTQCELSDKTCSVLTGTQPHQH
ncbi:MAG: cation diffusion facilitator family transporter [Bryobacteraceae bacterium]